MKYFAVLLLLETIATNTLAASEQFDQRAILVLGTHHGIQKRSQLVHGDVAPRNVHLKRTIDDHSPVLARRSGGPSSSRRSSSPVPQSNLRPQRSGPGPASGSPRAIEMTAQGTSSGRMSQDVASSSRPSGSQQLASQPTPKDIALDRHRVRMSSESSALLPQRGTNGQPSRSDSPQRADSPPRRNLWEDVNYTAQSAKTFAKKHPMTTALGCLGLAGCFTAGGGLGALAVGATGSYGAVTGGATALSAGMTAAGSIPLAAMTYHREKENNERQDRQAQGQARVDARRNAEREMNERDANRVPRTPVLSPSRWSLDAPGPNQMQRGGSRGGQSHPEIVPLSSTSSSGSTSSSSSL